MGRVFCTVTIVSLTFTACTPMGSVFTNDSDYDDFWTVPRRQTYNLGDSFNRDNDLWVFASNRGIVEAVSSKKVEIGLITNPGSANIAIITMLDESSSDDTYRLTDSNVGTGRKLIVVTFGDNAAEYSIEVTDPLGVSGGNGAGDENGDGSVIGIIWR